MRWIEGPLLTAVCCAAVLAAVWDAVEQAPLRGPWGPWNDIRTARCVATGWGLDLYAGAGEPALDGHIYGPAGFWLCGAAGLARSPSDAIRIATALSALFLLAPAWLLLSSGARERLLALRTVCLLALCSFWMIYPGAAWNPHVDAQAIGWMLVTCWAAFRLLDRPESSLWLYTCAFAAGAAVWTKQTAAPVLLFAPVLLWMAGHRRVALRTLAATVISGVLWGLAAGSIYGFEGVSLAMFELPGKHGWLPGTILLEHERLIELLPALLLAAVAIGLQRAGAPVSRRAVALGAVGLPLLPFAVAGRIKADGFSNNMLAPMIFVTVAAAVALLDALRSPDPAEPWKRWARGSLACLLVLLAARTAAHVTVRGLDRGSKHEESISDVAMRFALARPRQVHFPTRPLATLYADGAFYSTEVALRTRLEAGRDSFTLALPDDLRFVALEVPTPDLMTRLPGFTAEGAPELPGFTVYVRSGGEPQ